MHGPDSCNSTFGDTDPRTCEPDLRSLDVSDTASVPRSGAITGSTGSADSIPFGGTATEYSPELHGMVRWLERRLGNMPVDVPFNVVDLREQEQDFLFDAQQILPYEFCCLWRLRRQHIRGAEKVCQASVWFIAGRAIIFGFVYELFVTFGK